MIWFVWALKFRRHLQVISIFSFLNVGIHSDGSSTMMMMVFVALLFVSLSSTFSFSYAKTVQTYLLHANRFFNLFLYLHWTYYCFSLFFSFSFGDFGALYVALLSENVSYLYNLIVATFMTFTDKHHQLSQKLAHGNSRGR